MQLPPPAGSPRRLDPPPPPLCPPSRGALPATTDGGHDAAVSEHPGIKLSEWWLATVEGDDQKIAVAGTYERNHTVRELSPAPIVKRHAPLIVETEDGVVLLLSGSFSVSRTLSYGYSTKVCANFVVGFPHWWQSCNLHYPKQTSSPTGCRPFSSYTGNSGVDSTQFYLERYEQGNRLHLQGTSFINKLCDFLKSSSGSDAAIQKSSHLPNGATRFEEYRDGDIATNENTAAPGDVREKHEVATVDQRAPVVSLEVRGCCKETMRVALVEKAAVDKEMTTSVYLDGQNSFCLSDGTAILEEYTCDGDIPTNEDTAASNRDNERYRALSKEVNSMEVDSITGSTSTERGLDDIATNVSLAPTMECTPATDCQKNVASNGDNERYTALSKEVNNIEIGLIKGSTSIERGQVDIATNASLAPTVECTPATGRKKPPVASLKSQGCGEKNQHIALNKRPVGQPKKQRSATEKQPVGRPKKQRSATEKQPVGWPKKQSSATEKRPEDRPKKQSSTTEKQPVGQPKKQRSATEKQQSPRRSPVTRSPVLHASWSPFARGKALSTPEALKLKRSRSGRVIVPTLDPGCQTIVYDQDGSISSVIGLDSPATKGSESKADKRRKRTK